MLKVGDKLLCKYVTENELSYIKNHLYEVDKFETSFDDFVYILNKDGISEPFQINGGHTNVWDTFYTPEETRKMKLNTILC